MASKISLQSTEERKKQVVVGRDCLAKQAPPNWVGPRCQSIDLKAKSKAIASKSTLTQLSRAKEKEAVVLEDQSIANVRGLHLSPGDDGADGFRIPDE